MNRYRRELVVCVTFWIVEFSQTDFNVEGWMFFFSPPPPRCRWRGSFEEALTPSPMAAWGIFHMCSAAPRLPGQLPLSSALIRLLLKHSTIILFPLPPSFHCPLSPSSSPPSSFIVLTCLLMEYTSTRPQCEWPLILIEQSSGEPALKRLYRFH